MQRAVSAMPTKARTAGMASRSVARLRESGEPERGGEAAEDQHDAREGGSSPRIEERALVRWRCHRDCGCLLQVLRQW